MASRLEFEFASKTSQLVYPSHSCISANIDSSSMQLLPTSEAKASKMGHSKSALDCR